MPKSDKRKKIEAISSIVKTELTIHEIVYYMILDLYPSVNQRPVELLSFINKMEGTLGVND